MRRVPMVLDADGPQGGGGARSGREGGGPQRTSDAPSRTRQASVVLREESQSVSALMDPANRSLADALKITFRLLQLAMIVLFGLFAFSGLQTVREGESGLRLMFGQLAESDVPPGMRFALPPPIGEIVRVPTGNVEIEDASSFYPYVTAEVRAQGPDALNYAMSLNPARDGSVLTGDQGIAHLILRIQYRRTDPALYAENVLDAQTESTLVFSAVAQGVTRTCAEVTMDDLLRGQQPGAIADRAREVAQRTLDDARSGITIERVNLVQRIPPRYLQTPFNKVQTAVTDAQRLMEEAETSANQTRNSMAGLASEDLTALIGEYDRAMAQRATIEAGGTIPEAELLDADAILANIDAMLEGRPVTINGETVENLISGEATAILQRAAADRARLVNGRQATLQMFAAKLEQYRQNPAYMLMDEWATSYGVLLARDFTQKYVMPRDSAGMLEMHVNQDPAIIDQLDSARKERESREAAQRRMDTFMQGNFTTQTGTPARADP